MLSAPGMDRFIVLLIATGSVLVFFALCVGLAVLYRNVFGVKIWMRFLERTGYRRKVDPAAPLEMQAKAVLGELMRPEGVGRGPWVRPVDGQTLTYESLMYRDAESNVTQESWQIELPREPSGRVQVLERRLTHPSLLSVLGNAALGRERRWGALMPYATPTGDPTFDARFLVLSDRADAAPHFLADPSVRASLWDLPEACVVVGDRSIVLDDPAGALRKRHVGNAVSPSAMMELEPAVHDQAARTLAILSRAVLAA